MIRGAIGLLLSAGPTSLLCKGRETRMLRIHPGAAACLAAVVMVSAAEAGPVYSFTRVTDNAPTDVASTFSFEVNNGGSESGTNYVLFTFRNTGTADSRVHEIYFEDGALLALANTHWGTAGDEQGYNGNVDFYAGPKPAHPPGFSPADPFTASASFSADSRSHGGLNGGEWVTFRYSLQAGLDYASVIEALNLGLDGRDPHPTQPGRFASLRVALHVGGLQNGQSDTFLYDGSPEDPGTPIPLPGAAALSAVGLVLVAGRRRRPAAARC